MRLVDLSQRIGAGEYRVEPEAVADAIIRRVRERAAGQRPKSAQSACSYPESGSSASMNATPGKPATTRPMQLRPDGRNASISLAPARIQAHNS